MTLKGFTLLGESTISNDVQENLISYFDYNLLLARNFINVTLHETGYYGGLNSRLRPVDDPRYDSGQVWSTFRPNLVWESGVGAHVQSSGLPGVSGIYINNTYYPTSTVGAYSYHIDHINGAVRFNTAIAVSSVVECQYSYKYVKVTRSEGMPWFDQIQANSERSDGDFATQSGVYEILPENRSSLPIMGFEMAGRRLTPYQLGGGQVVETDVYCHCIAEDAYMRDALVDAVTYQSKISIPMYDLNTIDTNNDFPLDYRGVPQSGAKTYPNLQSAYLGRTLYIKDAKLDSSYMLGKLYVGSVKLTTEVIHFGV